jgi:putative hydrolase of the HAD superfamily
MPEPPLDTAATGSDQALIARIRQLTAAMRPQPTGLRPEIAPLDGIRAVLFDVYGTLVMSGCGDIGLTSQRAGEPTQLQAAQQVRQQTGQQTDQQTDQQERGQTGEQGAQPIGQINFLRALTAAGAGIASVPRHFDGAQALRETIAVHHTRSRAGGIDYPEVDILEVWGDLLARIGMKHTVSDIRCIALEYELLSNPVWPMPGLNDLIDALSRRGTVLGIVSNAQFYTPLMLTAFLGCDLATAGFDPRCCAWSFRHRVGKPSTRLFRPVLAALREHHAIAPNQVLYIGNDLRNDIWPASQLGCRTALFAGDARSLRLREQDADLHGLQPDRVLTALEQIVLNLLPK